MKSYIFFNECENVKSVENIENGLNKLAVLLNGRSTSKKLQYVAIEGLTSTKPEDVIKHLLKATLADARVKAGWDAEFFSFVDDETKKKHETELKETLMLKPYLSGQKVFYTDENGKIAGCIKCDKELSRTALVIKPDSKLLTYKGSELRKGLYVWTKAILKQFVSIQTLNAEFAKIHETAETKTATKSNKKRAKAKQKAEAVLTEKSEKTA